VPCPLAYTRGSARVKCGCRLSHRIDTLRAPARGSSSPAWTMREATSRAAALSCNRELHRTLLFVLPTIVIESSGSKWANPRRVRWANEPSRPTGVPARFDRTATGVQDIATRGVHGPSVDQSGQGHQLDEKAHFATADASRICPVAGRNFDHENGRQQRTEASPVKLTICRKARRSRCCSRIVQAGEELRGQEPRVSPMNFTGQATFDRAEPRV